MRAGQGWQVRSWCSCVVAAAAWGLAWHAGAARADDPNPFAARAGLDVARASASAWAGDSYLVYVENDEPVGAAGTAERWGYLFYSPSLDQSRAYSVRDGKVVAAGTLGMKFEAPPLSLDWIDSGAALEVGDRVAASEFRKAGGAQLTTMLLMRGAFQDEDPNQTTWTLIYTSPKAPSLFVVVDAAQAKVRRTWRG